MSSFVVSDKHISAIVTFAANRPSVFFHDNAGWRAVARDTLCQERLFTILKSANESAVADDRNEPQPEEAECNYTPTPASPVQVLKAIQCLEYQCSGWSVWQGSHAQRSLESIRRSAVESLPGYDDAKWSIA